MRTPSSIAFIAAIAFVTPILLADLPLGVLVALLAAIVAGALVWVGTYLGVRWAAPHQRTVRLGWVLGVLFLLIGTALAIPIKTHSMLLDMPTPNGGPSTLDSMSPYIGPLVMLVGSVLLARGIATICGGRIAR